MGIMAKLFRRKPASEVIDVDDWMGGSLLPYIGNEQETFADQAELLTEMRNIGAFLCGKNGQGHLRFKRTYPDSDMKKGLAYLRELLGKLPAGPDGREGTRILSDRLQTRRGAQVLIVEVMRITIAPA